MSKEETKMKTKKLVRELMIWKTKKLVRELMIWNRIVADDRAQYVAARKLGTEIYEVAQRRYEFSCDTLKGYEIKAIRKGIMRREDSYLFIGEEEI